MINLRVPFHSITLFLVAESHKTFRYYTPRNATALLNHSVQTAAVHRIGQVHQDINIYKKKSWAYHSSRYNNNHEGRDTGDNILS